ncbi:MAG: hypothetical protein KC476_10695 [Cyanobacteria bacterium HKST-UBA06]|nr:hypothetical protein [Cyanobacteria bacterium HKST-UBA05]MCA9808411.1 hypothetical protein [Cyanobacteria bacterium HKST-UBA06]
MSPAINTQLAAITADLGSMKSLVSKNTQAAFGGGGGGGASAHRQASPLPQDVGTRFSGMA